MAPWISAAVLAVLSALQPGSAPTTPKPEEGIPGPLPAGFPAEHRLLAEMAGTFTAKVTIPAGEGQPPSELAGTAVRRVLLGERFLRDTLDVTQGPAPFTLETTLGYNPDGPLDGRFELTRLSSAAFPTMTERGSFDPASKVFTFKGEHLIGGKRARTRSVLRLEAFTTHILEVYVAYEDPADPRKVLTPEFRAYTVEYERAR